MVNGERIITRVLEEEMKSAYIDYSMSVIVSRALPDVRDGLKPVHRRVLYGMTELGLSSGRAHKKSARIVGEVLGKYHPHGDSAVYDTMVRMAQPWSLRYPLVDGQGNFGSIDGDNPAAMRYTEARLQRIAEELLADIKKNTVDFKPNFDDSLTEPTVLPARIPNLLVNGASGIAVGMATNMPPHNLTEVVNGIKAYIDDNEITVDGLMEYVTGPDFPTGGTIYGVVGIRQAYMMGKGRVVVRAKAEIEPIKNSYREQIIITEIPYQVNKASTIEKIGNLVSDKRLEGIADVRDESDRKGMRIVIELKRDVVAQIVLNKLYQMTPLQTAFNVNNVALVNGRPVILNLKDMIRHYVDHRHEVVIRRTEYELAQARQRAHILEGLLIALRHLDEVIALIRSSKTPDAARSGLMERFSLSEIQAKAILDMRLQRLTGLERDKIERNYAEIQAKIAEYERILGDESIRMDIIKTELEEVKERYGGDRRTNIVHAEGEISLEDLIENKDMVITISHHGYIKRTPAEEYRVQGRGGVGAKGAGTKDEDFVEHIFVARTHNYMLFFTQGGRCYWLKVHEIPKGDRYFKGRAIQNVIQIPKEDKVQAYLTVESFDDEEFLNSHYIVLATRNGVVKKTVLKAFSRPRVTGVNAIGIREGDGLIEAKLTDGNSEIMIASKNGRAVRFHEKDAREMGRTASGVRGIRLEEDGEDEAIGMVIIPNEDVTLLVISEKGYGKRSSVSEFRITKRGGKGVKSMKITSKTGKVIAIKQVIEGDDIMIITREGITIRMEVDGISKMGRDTQGVRLIRLREEDKIASVARISEHEEEEEENTEAENENKEAVEQAPVEEHTTDE